MRGQPPDTASMNFEQCWSSEWVMVSLTASSMGSISIAHREKSSAFNSGLNSLRHPMTSRCLFLRRE
jgi:hypothetical protein